MEWAGTRGGEREREQPGRREGQRPEKKKGSYKEKRCSGGRGMRDRQRPTETEAERGT